MIKDSISKFLYKNFSRKRPNLRQIIICGFPRSGTSLMFNYISSITTKEIRPYVSKKTTTNEFSGIYLLRRIKSYITKRPEDCFKIEDIVKWNVKDKRILIILCVRDPRNLVTSKHHKRPDDYYLNLNERWLPIENKVRPNGLIQFQVAIEKVLQRKNYYQKKRVHIKLVKYEEFVKNKEMIDNFLKDHQVPLNNTNIKSRLPYGKKQVGRGHEGDFTYEIDSHKWMKTEEDKSRVKEIFEKEPEFFQRVLEFFGYEDSKNWQSVLKRSGS